MKSVDSRRLPEQRVQNTTAAGGEAVFLSVTC